MITVIIWVVIEKIYTKKSEENQYSTKSIPLVLNTVFIKYAMFDMIHSTNIGFTQK